MPLSSSKIPFLLPYFLDIQCKSFIHLLEIGLVREILRITPLVVRQGITTIKDTKTVVTPALLRQYDEEFLKANVGGYIPTIRLLNMFPDVETSTESQIIQIKFHPHTYRLICPPYDPKTAILKKKTYGSDLYMVVELACQPFQHKFLKSEGYKWMRICHLPLLTKRGHFIINGVPRVIINQIVRSPGLYGKIKRSVVVPDRITYYSDLISNRGAWLRFLFDTKKCIWIQMKKGKKIPVLIFLRALGYSEQTLQTILTPTEWAILLESKHETEQIESEDYLHPFDRCDALTKTYKLAYPYFISDEITIYRKQQLPEINYKNAINFLRKKFFSKRTYDLGYAGRNWFNEKFIKKTLSCALTNTDILNLVRYFLKTVNSARAGDSSSFIDDIDHLKNRRIRTCGELIKNQMVTGLMNFQLTLKKNPSLKSLVTIENYLKQKKPIEKPVIEFFNFSPLSQFMDETNAIAELTHKRRISSLGEGGVTRQTATIKLRGIHPTYYGRICPIETPEGRNAGLVNSLTTLGQVNQASGFLETPVYQFYKNKMPSSSVFISARQQQKINVITTDSSPNHFGFLSSGKFWTNINGEFINLRYKQVKYSYVSSIQMISIATCLIPFLEHDDATRALMGSNMQRQAVPLVCPEKPILGTGFETRPITDVVYGALSRTSGYVDSSNKQTIVINSLLFNTVYSNKKLNNNNQKQKINLIFKWLIKLLTKNEIQDTNDNSIFYLYPDKILQNAKNLKTKVFDLEAPLLDNFKKKKKNKYFHLYKWKMFTNCIFVKKTGFWKSKNKLEVSLLLASKTNNINLLNNKKFFATTNIKNNFADFKLKLSKINTNFNQSRKLREFYVYKIHFFNFPSTNEKFYKNLLSVIKNKNNNIVFGEKNKNSVVVSKENPSGISSLVLFKKLKETVNLNQAEHKIFNVTNSSSKQIYTLNDIILNYINIFMDECSKLIFSQIFIEKKNIKHIFFYICVNWLNFNIKKFNKIFYYNNTHCLFFFKKVYFPCIDNHEFKNINFKLKPIDLHITKMEKLQTIFLKKYNKKIKQKPKKYIFPFSYTNKIIIDSKKKNLHLNLNKNFIYYPIDGYKKTDMPLFKHEKLNVGSINTNKIFKTEKIINTIFSTETIHSKQKNRVFNFNLKTNFKYIRKIKENHFLQTYQHSDQNTNMTQTPLVCDGEWIQKNDLLTDGAASAGNENALGLSSLIAYLPWEGYNFEDAILVNENLISNDSYTSIHIYRYAIHLMDTPNGKEQFTKAIPYLPYQNWHKLDDDGIIKLGSRITAGEIIAGKLTPRNIKQFFNSDKLISKLDREYNELKRNSSFRVPKFVSGYVVYIEKLINPNLPVQNKGDKFSLVHIYVAQKRKLQIGDKMSGRHGNKGIISNILPRQDMPYLPDGTAIDIILNPLGVPSRMNVGQIFECLLGFAGKLLHEQFRICSFNEMSDNQTNRDLVYSKLFQARIKTKRPWIFNPNTPGKMRIFDGRTGDSFWQSVTVGNAYMLKLIHLADDKIHARSVGPYLTVTQQPVRGKRKRGGQRLGEMEVWALEGFGAAYTLQELLTIKSDDIDARRQIIRSYIVDETTMKKKIFPAALLANQPITVSVPDAFMVAINELQALCLDIGVYNFNRTGYATRFNVLKLTNL